MAFVRAKVVEGYTYYQLVHNYREAGKHRQKVLCHLGKHSSLDKAVEDKRREEEELRDKAVRLFDITTEHKETILERYGEMVGREVPSSNKAAAMNEDGWESFKEAERGYPFDHPESRKRWHVARDTYQLFKDVRKYESMRWKALWYDDRANKAQEKKGKLMEVKEKYPHL